MRRFICFLFGHRYDMDYAHFCGMYSCDRCKRETDYYQPGLMPILARCAYEWLEEAWHGFSVWWKCRDCGWHFGRHDPKHDHIPF